ncbi:MAG: nitrous oxide reductase accessory protein NosL [Rhodanobacter sp.]
MKIDRTRRCSKQGRFTSVAWLPVALLVSLLAACGSSQAPSAQAAVDIHKGDACAVCGMYLDAGPGPRAEAWVQGYKTPLKFGSTRDFFAYVLDPENRTGLQQLLVQDSAQINWQHPSNQATTFVDARSAWYVAWQPLSGLMGPTFASFATRHDAEAFIRVQGGEILSFSAVTPRMTSLLGYTCPSAGSPAFALARACTVVTHPAGSALATQDGHADLLHGGRAVPQEVDPAQQGRKPALLDARTH